MSVVYLRQLLLISSLVWLVGCTALEAETTTPAVKPNVVILFADDLGYGDLGSFGHPYIRTPNLDAMAREGQRWTDFYVAAPVCSPSRGALLTGRLPVRTGLYGERIGVYFPDDPGGMPEREVTLAEALKAVGYHTGMFGKWHLGDAKTAWPTRHGFDEWLGLPYSNDMDWVNELGIDEIIKLNMQGKVAEVAQALSGRAEKYAMPQRDYWNVPLYSSRRTALGFEDKIVERPAEQTTLTQRYTAAAIDFIRRNADAPFLAYVPYTMPHTPLFRSKEFAQRSLGGRYGDVVEEIDASAGAIRDVLRELGIERNTLVIFTSDNGPWLTMNTEGGLAGLLRHGKGTTFEGGMRVPTVMSWPGRLRPGIVSEIGSTLDLFRTITALAGADTATGVDGYDLAPVLFGDARSPRVEMPFYRSGKLYAYRLGAWKLHFVTEGAYRQPPERTEHATPLLFNLAVDPAERFDVAEAHPDKVAELLVAVQRHRSEVETAPPEFDRRLARLTK